MTDAARTVLITGISGFVAQRTAIEFLTHGYRVRGTVRSAAKAGRVRSLLAPHADVWALAFAEADLMQDTGWDAAVAGCDFVAHVASPFPLAQPRDEDELIRPAVDGTLRVLRAAARGGVKRFIQTSSTVAIAYGHPHSRTTPLTERDWSDLAGTGITAYVKSKTLAERAARDFMAGQDGGMSFASVNPSFILGPVIDEQLGSSADLVRMLMAGKYPGTPRLSMFCVDVRDVARCQRLAMEYDGPMDRFLLSDRVLWFRDFATALRAGLGERGRKVPKRQLPDFLVRLIGLFDPAVRAILPDLGKFIPIDNSATRAALGVDFIPAEEAALATGESLIELGVIR